MLKNTYQFLFSKTIHFNNFGIDIEIYSYPHILYFIINHIFSLVFIINVFIFNIVYTGYFGWNFFPQTKEELFLDFICFLSLIFYSILFNFERKMIVLRSLLNALIANKKINSAEELLNFLEIKEEK